MSASASFIFQVSSPSSLEVLKTHLPSDNTQEAVVWLPAVARNKHQTALRALASPSKAWIFLLQSSCNSECLESKLHEFHKIFICCHKIILCPHKTPPCSVIKQLLLHLLTFRKSYSELFEIFKEGIRCYQWNSFWHKMVPSWKGLWLLWGHFRRHKFSYELFYILVHNLRLYYGWMQLTWPLHSSSNFKIRLNT